VTSWTTTVGSPVGDLLLVADGQGRLTHLLFDRARTVPSAVVAARRDRAPFARALTQLDEYFAGTRQGFDLDLAPHGTAFQLAAWSALRDIPYGETRSYSQQAAALGRPTAVRAVGAANGRNPLSIVVPCHRVVGATGSLTGYGGGLEIKRWLLAHERAQQQTALPLG
jgi:methylated-DNA-[protein]-cysteine S-methyltransferase